MNNIPWIGGNSQHRDNIHWQRRMKRDSLNIMRNNSFITNDPTPAKGPTQQRDADLTFDDIMALIWRVQEWHVVANITASGNYQLGTDWSVNWTWDSIIRRTYSDITTSFLDLTDERNLFGAISPNELSHTDPSNQKDLYLNDVLVGIENDNIVTQPVVTGGFIPPGSAPTLSGFGEMFYQRPQRTEYDRTGNILYWLDDVDTFSGSIAAVRFPTNLQLHATLTDIIGGSSVGLQVHVICGTNTAMPFTSTTSSNSATFKIGSTIFQRDMMAFHQSIGPTINLTGAISLTASKYFAFQNRAGQPVYDTSTGVQINDPFA